MRFLDSSKGTGPGSGTRLGRFSDTPPTKPNINGIRLILTKHLETVILVVVASDVTLVQNGIIPFRIGTLDHVKEAVVLALQGNILVDGMHRLGR